MHIRPKIDPILLSVNETCRCSGLSRSKVYLLLREGKISARKFGKNTLIEAESLRALLASLPAATFRQPSPV